MKVPDEQQVGKAHEQRDVDVVNLGMIGLLLFTMIAIALLVCWMTLRSFTRAQANKTPLRQMQAEEATKFPQPRLITRPGHERQQNDLREETLLQSYGWIDRKSGVAHIPIERAMELLLERGLPEVGAGQTRLQLRQSRPITIEQPRDPVTTATPAISP
jgi:hypothetical protein